MPIHQVASGPEQHRGAEDREARERGAESGAKPELAPAVRAGHIFWGDTGFDPFSFFHGVFGRSPIF